MPQNEGRNQNRQSMSNKDTREHIAETPGPTQDQLVRTQNSAREWLLKQSPTEVVQKPDV